MATKRIKDLTTTATSADLVLGRFGVLDTPNITKKFPAYFLGGGGDGNGIEYIDETITPNEVNAIIDGGKLPVMRVVTEQECDYYYLSHTGIDLTFVHIGRNGVVVKMWDNQLGSWTNIAGYDTELSSTSTNAVQNSTLYAVIGNVETLLANL